MSLHHFCLPRHYLKVEISGPVSGKAVWPSNLKPVAWHNDGEKVRMKIGLYHFTHNVADGDVSQSTYYRVYTVHQHAYLDASLV